MLPFAYYLLKVIICSGILYVYYVIALRDKTFHKWNRFFLMAAMILSLTAPLIKINIWQKDIENKTQVVQLLQVVSSGDEFVYEYSKDKGNFQANASYLSLSVYIIVSFLLFTFLIRTLYKINRLKRSNRQTMIEGVNFINTNAKGTPFSFFNNIFWNDQIDINTPTGKQIFRHEVAHVQEKHSHDKVFVNIALIFFWVNPFFWLIRKELNMIHEFIADKKALEDNDTAAFAAMILQATYPDQRFNITNNFFYSPLKRRLLMLTKNKNPKINYASRLLALPLAALVFFAFTLKSKKAADHYTGKKITVVIDAGHGGEDNGSVVDNIKEKDLTLSIAREIKKINNNENINIILSRGDDEYIHPKDRVIFAESNKADLFISIHFDAEVNKNTLSGINILIPNNDNTYLNASKVLGTFIMESFRNNYQLQVARDVKQPGKGVWILKANQYPTVLVEAAVLTSQKDLEYLRKVANLKIIAKNILNGIERYAQQLSIVQGNEAIKISSFDSIPQFYKGKKVKEAYGSQKLNKAVIIYDDASRDTIGIAEAEKLRFIPPPPPAAREKITINGPLKDSTIKLKNTDNALIVLDGLIISRDKNDLKAISPNSIQSISVLKDEQAIKKYGNKGKDGVIEITTKQTSDIAVPPDPIINNSYKTIPLLNKTVTKTEIEASFPGGNEAWTRYIKKRIEANIKELIEEGKSGTCLLRFFVNTDGTVSNVTALSMQGTKLAEIAVNAIMKGPMWSPAKQNGKYVASYRQQPVTFTMQEDNKVFTKVEVEPSFPGGDIAWMKYIKKMIETHIDELATENKSGTCRVRFIVDTDGTISSVEALTMKGTKLAEVAVDGIRKGPKWNPAMQNGQVVATYKEVPVTFTIEPN